MILLVRLNLQCLLLRILFLDLSFHVNEWNKVYVGVYAKPAYNFTYVLPSTCYPKMNINNVPKSVAVRLARICDSDKKFDTRSEE